jgi:hypothetical protein
LKPEWWGSPLAQEEKYQATREYNNNNNNSIQFNSIQLILYFNELTQQLQETIT